MDLRLVGWARHVKARRSGAGPGSTPLWLFADPARVADLEAAIHRLPVGLAGVVLREGFASRGRAIAALCRRRRVVLVVAGDMALAARLRAGVHLRAGEGRPRFRPPVVTSSAHNAQQVRRARQAGAAVVFLSPVFTTMSHPGAPSLGVLRWSALARRSVRFGALGGVDGSTLRRLPRWCRQVGAVGALVAATQPRP